MKRPKLEKLLKSLNLEIKKARDIAQKTKKSAEEIAKASVASPSQSGDREHSKNQSEIVQDYLDEILIVCSEVEKEIEKKIPEKIEGICFVRLNFDDGKEEDYYLTNNPVKLEGIKFISQNSPLGQKLSRKSMHDHFELENPPVSGSIEEIG